MTGFGRGSAAAAGLDVTVEVRAVNGRYAEVAVRAPRSLAPYEAEIQNRARAALERGKIAVSVQAERVGAAAAGVRLDESAAKAYVDLLERLRFITRVQQPVGLDHLLQFRDLIVPQQEEEKEQDPEALWAATEAALGEALRACRQMRQQEGSALAEDLGARLDAIEQELEAVEATAPHRLTAARDTLRARVADLMSGPQGVGGHVDPDRLEMEIALLADRLDVHEECIRLRSHLDQFRQALEAVEPVGRRLNFLSQEFNREINTIASKANDAGIAHRAVTMKEELEKIREQVQNVV